MKKNEKFSLIYFWLITLMIIFTQLLFFPDRPANVRLSYRDFLNALDSGKVARIVIFEDRIVGEFKS
ncbi:MAG TPA: ATP-dependent metallopeptidase FtsH/Yme1/Tma family protein, partial [Candidatus Marinimicrobia bacterium]|nr:ATP-dependent metallopeptidase FtsH/Yme1/Tma family protein [Candidatus Neomarinimicrobiota bacterium]